MIHTYNISGMTCSGCKAAVESSLSSLEAIKTASANLEDHEVTLEMTKHLDIETLQNALSEKYKISEQTKTNVFGSSSQNQSKSEKSELKQLFPLFLIFGYILITSVLLNLDFWNISAFMLDFMGLFYIIFSFFKFLDISGFAQSFRMYDPLAKKVLVYGTVYPFIELGLGLLFLMRYKVEIALVLTLIVLGITTYGVTKTLLDKKSIQCACLGSVLDLPMTKATFIENSIMIAMAILMLIKTYAL
ncbi:heavy metal translocating P-type ATPase [Winogradskyella aurantia]|uniref:Heavy metal transporter n=1 Tax=Winogradskyella aurantia TaxID=1915063 RepID=A0A265UV00_9FLAO|nr:MauE/DoxX family redox-associated membrane protein [Winogradskyella aurantia]OZV69135.1 heavy metal transporter [Winogradskyella aurantia]